MTESAEARDSPAMRSGTALAATGLMLDVTDETVTHLEAQREADESCPEVELLDEARLAVVSGGQLGWMPDG